MDLTERKISGEYRYKGKIVNIRFDKVMLPNGDTATREVCEHPGGVAILPLTDRGEVVMVRQYRYSYGEELLEIPAGKMNSKEEGHYRCGIRELKEETGITPKEFIYLGAMYPSPGILTEVIHLYLAKGLDMGEPSPDEDEFLRTEHVPFEKLKQMICEDKVRDAKTIAAVFRTSMLLRKTETEG